MSDRQEVSLSQHRVREIRTVLAASDVIVGELQDKLPQYDENATLELEKKHREILLALVSAYTELDEDDLAEPEIYSADHDTLEEIVEII